MLLKKKSQQQQQQQKKIVSLTECCIHAIILILFNMSGVCCGIGEAEGPEFDLSMLYSGLTPTTKE